MSKIYNEYLKLKKIDSNKLYLFKCGKFYIFLDEDCDLINEYVVLKKTPFSKETNKCGFPENSLEQYIKVFKNHKLNIEIINEIKKEDSIINEIKNLDINKITPIESLLFLKRIKEYFNEKCS